MTKIRKKFIAGICFALLFAAAAFPCVCWAVFGEDMEKPKPEFTRQEDKIIAKLIPRGKSTSVKIEFEVLGGKLLEVKGMDFTAAARPEVDIKNFKSALFTVEIGDVSPPGGEVKVSVTSQFFTSSTKYYIFNEKLEKEQWMKPEIQNLSHPNFVQQLVINVKDGGPFDSDGAVNGKIFFVGGPRDSFWGYALGTLVIRFVGVFLVLGVLMIGMLISGKFFQITDQTPEKPVNAAAPQTPVQTVQTETPAPALTKAAPVPEAEIAAAAALAVKMASRDEFSEYETAAAIMTALHLHLFGQCNLSETEGDSQGNEDAETGKPGVRNNRTVQTSSGWVQQGRGRMMESRLQSFNRK